MSFLKSDSSARIQRIILLEAEIEEIRKNLKKYNEFSPDCTYTDSTAMDNQVREKKQGYIQGCILAF